MSGKEKFENIDSKALTQLTNHIVAGLPPNPSLIQSTIIRLMQEQDKRNNNECKKIMGMKLELDELVQKILNIKLDRIIPLSLVGFIEKALKINNDTEKRK